MNILQARLQPSNCCLPSIYGVVPSTSIDRQQILLRFEISLGDIELDRLKMTRNITMPKKKFFPCIFLKASNSFNISSEKKNHVT